MRKKKKSQFLNWSKTQIKGIYTVNPDMHCEKKESATSLSCPWTGFTSSIKFLGVLHILINNLTQNY